MDYNMKNKILQQERKIELTEDEKRVIVEYGLERGKKELLFWGYIVLVGVALGVLWQGLVFWISFCAIRRYAGGYHADTEKRCLCISAVVILLVFLSMKYCTWGDVGTLPITRKLLWDNHVTVSGFKQKQNVG